MTVLDSLAPHCRYAQVQYNWKLMRLACIELYHVIIFMWQDQCDLLIYFTTLPYMGSANVEFKASFDMHTRCMPWDLVIAVLMNLANWRR